MSLQTKQVKFVGVHLIKWSLFLFKAHRGGGDSLRASTESEMSIEDEQTPEELWSKKVTKHFCSVLNV